MTRTGFFLCVCVGGSMYDLLMAEIRQIFDSYCWSNTGSTASPTKVGTPLKAGREKKKKNSM